MTSLENIMSHYNSLNDGDSGKAILRGILRNVRRLPSMSIQELAEDCSTSASTISRIVKLLGYQDYHEFRSAVGGSVKQYSHHNRFCQELPTLERDAKSIVCDSVENVLQTFREKVSVGELLPIAEAMHRADAIHIFSYGILFMENTLQSDLILSGKPCDIVCGDHKQIIHAANLKSGDFALFMCPDAIDGYPRILEAIDAAARKRACICIFTSSDRQILRQRAEFLMSFSGQQHMVDSFYLELLLAALDLVYREKYLDSPEGG